MGDESREIRRSVRHDIRVIEGVAQGGQAREGASREKVGAGGAACSDDVQGQYGASGDSVGEDGPHPKIEGGLQEHRVGKGNV